jgi:hypothetical protein
MQAFSNNNPAIARCVDLDQIPDRLLPFSYDFEVGVCIECAANWDAGSGL